MAASIVWRAAARMASASRAVSSRYSFTAPLRAVREVPHTSTSVGPSYAPSRWRRAAVAAGVTSGAAFAFYGMQRSSMGVLPRDDPMGDLAAALNDAFEPEPRRKRSQDSAVSPRRPSAAPSSGQQLIGSLIVANIGVYVLWKIPVPAMQSFMLRWFTTSALSFQQGVRGFISNFTSNYSHSGIIHLGFNMLALNSFGRHLMDGRSTADSPKLTPTEFFAMYTLAGFVGSLTSNLFAWSNGVAIPGLGASGAIFAVASYFMLAQPHATVRFMFVLDMSSQTALAVLTGINVGLCVWQRMAARNPVRFGGPTVDGMAHLGGTAIGIAYYYWASARQRQRDGERQRLADRWTGRGSDV